MRYPFFFPRRTKYLTPGWPEETQRVRVSDYVVHLRPVQPSDARAWSTLRINSAPNLEPVEPTAHTSWEEAHSPAAWRAVCKQLHAQAAMGQLLPYAIMVDNHFAGQLTLGGITRGASQDAWIGYWLGQEFAGHGIGTAACALGIDHAFGAVHLHRIYATCLPTNDRSRRVLEKVGFHEEGFLRRNLHINGRWQDHILMAILSDDYPMPAITRLHMSGGLG